MGQNLALNIAEKGFAISVCNRSPAKVDTCVERAGKEGLSEKVKGFKDVEKFVKSIKKPRAIIILVKAGKPVEAVIDNLMNFLEEGDMIVDGGNEKYENTEARIKKCEEKKLLYMGMGVSGGEEGARKGPSMMPGGSEEGYNRIKHILTPVSAQHKSGKPCVAFLGKGGSGNYVKMVHNGIEYGDMQLIAEAYDVLKQLCNLTNDKLADVFDEWNKGELESFLIEISRDIFKKKDDRGDASNYLLDQVLDKTGSKGTGKWTVQSAGDVGTAVPSISAALNARFMACLKKERIAANGILKGPQVRPVPEAQQKAFIEDVKRALYAAKISCYAQGMSLLQRKSAEMSWDIKLGKCAEIWRGGCIIRAVFLDRITEAFERNADLANLMIDDEFAKEIQDRQDSWRRVVTTAVANGIATPAFSASLAYFDSYRRENLPANMTQAQRDFFGAHTYQRKDNMDGDFVHSEWAKPDAKADA